MYRRKTYRVARLVCEAFHGSPPDGADTIHIDEDPRINRPKNLKWGTRKENLNCPKFKTYCAEVFAKKLTGQMVPNLREVTP